MAALLEKGNLFEPSFFFNIVFIFDSILYNPVFFGSTSGSAGALMMAIIELNPKMEYLGEALNKNNVLLYYGAINGQRFLQRFSWAEVGPCALVLGTGGALESGDLGWGDSNTRQQFIR